MTTLIAFILVLGFLVFIHEFGHFIVAKWAGVNVETFSIGFGPAIFKKKYKGTLYQVACIPLGGYVKMTGEDPHEELAAADGKESDPADKPDPSIPKEAYFSEQPVKKRLAIVLAGPAMNFALALLLVPVVYMIGIEVDATLYEKPVVAYVDSDSAAAKAGMIAGDVVLAINDKSMTDWKKVKTYILFHPNRDLQFKVQRGSDIQSMMIPSTLMPQMGGGTIGGFYPTWPSQIKRIQPGKPAALAGMQEGDLIIQLGQDLQNPHWVATQKYIQTNPGKEIAVQVRRKSGEEVWLKLTPQAHPEAPEFGFVGIEPVQGSVIRRFGPLKAFQLGLQENIENTLTTFVVVGKLLNGDLKIKAVGGPVQIAEFTGAAAKEGVSHLLLFTAFISLQLAIMNLLPIPVLDGGHVFFMLIESLKGSPLSIRKRLIAQQVGMFLLLSLMVVVTFNDIARHKTFIFGLFKDFLP